VPSASSIRHKPSSWDCASIGNVKQRHRKDTVVLHLYDLSTGDEKTSRRKLGGNMMPFIGCNCTLGHPEFYRQELAKKIHIWREITIPALAV
jgi:hypothetical protein